ncbi:MAG: glutamyl-tRNA reductase [Verrucomicrobiota bacterium]|jgi:glutamyl-tRNA reductase
MHQRPQHRPTASFVVIGLSHHDAPVPVREAMACGGDAAMAFLGALRSSGLATEGVLVSTCNRVEVHAAVPASGPGAACRLRDWVAQERGLSPAEATLLRVREGPAGVEHLFRVAAGLESLVLGETEILGQLKRAYEAARACGSTGPVLNRVFQRAFAAAKQARSETGIQRGHTSVASVAVDLASRLFKGLAGRRVLVLGAGEAGEATARTLVARGASSVLVANRSFERAESLASELGGKAIRFDALESEFEAVDVVISTTGAPHHVLGVARLERLLASRPSRALLLVDLAVPRDIDPEVRRLAGVHLFDMDDLQGVVEAQVEIRRGEAARCDEIVRAHMEAWMGTVGLAAPEAGPR